MNDADNCVSGDSKTKSAAPKQGDLVTMSLTEVNDSPDNPENTVKELRDVVVFCEVYYWMVSF